MSTALRSVLPSLTLPSLTLPALLSAFAAGLPGQSSPYRTIDLGPVPGASPIAGVTADDISSDGNVITGGSWDPYVWTRGTGMRRLPLPAGQLAGLASTVNDAGFVAGYAGLSAAPNYRALLWDPLGNLTQLHQPAWVWSLVASINNGGEMLMAVALPNGTSIGESHAFLRSPAGALLDLTAGQTSGSAIALNEAGQALFASSAGIMLRDPSGQVTTIPNTYSPWHLSELGQIIGLQNNDVGVWTAGLGWQQIPDGVLRMARPGGINSFGQIGASHSVQTGVSPPRYAYYGHLYTEGLGWIDLEALTDRSEVTRIYQVEGITDTGALAASGSIGPDNRAMLIEPRHVTVFGDSCPDGAGLPPKALVAGDTRVGGRMALLGAGGPSQSPVVFMLSTGSASLPLPGNCTLLLDPLTSVAVPLTSNGAGQVAVPVVVPAFAAGNALWFQYAVLDSTAPNGAFALSNGVRLDVP